MKYDKIPPDKELKADDYKKAFDVQSACNLSGVARAFAHLMDRIWAEARAHGQAGDFVNTHPICRMYAEQIIFLTSGVNSATGDYTEAHLFCEDRLAKLTAAETLVDEKRQLLAVKGERFIFLYDCSDKERSKVVRSLDIDFFPDTVNEVIAAVEKDFCAEVTNFNHEDGNFYF